MDTRFLGGGGGGNEDQGFGGGGADLQLRGLFSPVLAGLVTFLDTDPSPISLYSLVLINVNRSATLPPASS